MRGGLEVEKGRHSFKGGGVLKDSQQGPQVSGKTESGPRPWRTAVVPIVYRTGREMKAETR